MKRGYLLLTLLWVFSCQTLPEIHHTGDRPIPKIRESCAAIFPDGKWQFVHSIEATMSGGQKGFMIGITRIQRKPVKIRCVMMTVEGFVLFDAEYDQKIVIHRGLAPFDAIDFATGVMADIRLMFIPPRGRLIESGWQENGFHVCRYQNDGISTVDIHTGPENRWGIHKYDYSRRLIRSVVAVPGVASTLPPEISRPSRLEFTAHGRYGYSLLMDLIEARQLPE